MKTFYKYRTPTQLNNRLIDVGVPVKRIPTLINLLGRISSWNFNSKTNKYSPTPIYWKTMEEHLGPYYRNDINIMISSGLLEVNESYLPSTEKYDGYNKEYYVPKNALTLLCDSNMSYVVTNIKSNHGRIIPETIIKQKQSHIIKHLEKNDNRINNDIREDSDDEVLNKISSNLNVISVDLPKLKTVLKRYSLEKRNHNLYMLVSIIEGTYKVKRIERNGRIWNPLTELSKEVKSTLSLNGKPLCCVLDIRSCYPTLWGQYIRQTFSHIDFSEELTRYNNIFLSRTVSPKMYLSKALKIDIESIKQIMINFFNGYDYWNNENYKKFDTWLEKYFPLMYKYWKSTDIKDTGCAIGRMYESPLMLEKTTYELAQSLNLDLLYENDGYGVYGDFNKVEILLNHLKNLSIEKCGIEMVFTYK